MNTRFFIFLFFVSTVSSTVFIQARNIHFLYDAAGNCIQKYKTIVFSRSMSVEDDFDFDFPEDWGLTDDVFGEIRTVIFPNPTRGILQVEFQNKDTNISVHYRLTDMNGRGITEGITFDSLLMLDLSNMPTATYLLNLTINGKSEIYKIIKQ